MNSRAAITGSLSRSFSAVNAICRERDVAGRQCIAACRAAHSRERSGRHRRGRRGGGEGTQPPRAPARVRLDLPGLRHALRQNSFSSLLNRRDAGHGLLDTAYQSEPGASGQC